MQFHLLECRINVSEPVKLTRVVWFNWVNEKITGQVIMTKFETEEQGLEFCQGVKFESKAGENKATTLNSM